MEVLKVRDSSTSGFCDGEGRRAEGWGGGGGLLVEAACVIFRMSELLQCMYKVSTSEIRSCMCHCCSLSGPCAAVFIEFIESCVCVSLSLCVCVDSQAVVVLL